MVYKAECCCRSIHCRLHIVSLSRPADAKEPEHHVDRTQSQKFILYIYWTVLEGKLRKEHMVYDHVLKPCLPLRNNFFKTPACVAVLIEFIFAAAKAANTPILCCLGTGNKLDASKFQITDISKTSVCPLARVMRKECAKRGYKHVKVLFSTEDPLPSQMEEEDLSELPEGRRSLPGSVAFVPSVAGLLIAGEVIKDLTK